MVFELQFLDWLQTLQTPILNEIMKAVTHLGDAGALWIILAAVLLAFPKTRKSGANRCGCAYCRSCVMQRDLEKYICPHAPV